MYVYFATWTSCLAALLMRCWIMKLGYWITSPLITAIVGLSQDELRRPSCDMLVVAYYLKINPSEMLANVVSPIFV